MSEKICMQSSHLRSLIVGAALCFVILPARADTLYADFTILFGVPSASGGNVTFALNPDGTIAASLVSLDGPIAGFGFDSVGSSALPLSNFSNALTNPVDNPNGFIDIYGFHHSGFLLTNFFSDTSVNWTIGNPGDFSSVFQAIGGGAADYDFFLFPGNGNQWAADAQSSLATPLPAALPLFATGLGALGLLGWRRKKKPVSLTGRVGP